MLQGSLTYVGILGTLLFTVFGKWFSQGETEALAAAIITIGSLAVAAYGRYRQSSVSYK